MIIFFGMYGLGVSTLLEDLKLSLHVDYDIHKVGTTSCSTLLEEVKKIPISDQTLIMVDDIEKCNDFAEVVEYISRQKAFFLGGTHYSPEYYSHLESVDRIDFVELLPYDLSELAEITGEPSYNHLMTMVAKYGLIPQVYKWPQEKRKSFLKNLLSETIEKVVMPLCPDYSFEFVLATVEFVFLNSEYTINRDLIFHDDDESNFIYRILAVSNLLKMVPIYPKSNIYSPVVIFSCPDIGIAQAVLDKNFKTKDIMVMLLRQVLINRDYQIYFVDLEFLTKVDIVACKKGKTLLIQIEAKTETVNRARALGYSLLQMKIPGSELYIVTAEEKFFETPEIKFVSLNHFIKAVI